MAKIGNNCTIYSCYYHFSAVSMVTQEPVFPENDQFNVRHYTSTSICWIFSKNTFIKLSLCLVFLKLFTDVFLLLFKLHLSCQKNACGTIF